MTESRREFIGHLALGAAALGLGCCAARQSTSRDSTDARAAHQHIENALGPHAVRLLLLAGRAASSHNTQPWKVQVRDERHWKLFADMTRQLAVVDPTARELWLSLGGFVENLVSAAAAYGQTVEPNLRTQPENTIELLFEARKQASRDDIEAIAKRRTLRKGLYDTPLQPEVQAELRTSFGEHGHYFPRGSKEATKLAEYAIASMEQQTASDRAQAELASWTRLDTADVAIDGLTPSSMEMGNLASFYTRHFMTSESVLGETFRKGGIDATREQITQGAGFLVVTSPSSTVADFIEAGRRFARFGNRAGRYQVATHPMSQMLEEDPWRARLSAELGLMGECVWILRLGRVNSIPAPVSPRRPVGDFVVLDA